MNHWSPALFMQRSRIFIEYKSIAVWMCDLYFFNQRCCFTVCWLTDFFALYLNIYFWSVKLRNITNKLDIKKYSDQMIFTTDCFCVSRMSCAKACIIFLYRNTWHMLRRATWDGVHVPDQRHEWVCYAFIYSSLLDSSLNKL